jgi:hypothetical protein
MNKTCSRCKTEKDYSEFMKCSAKKNGVGSWCNECSREHARIKHIENKAVNNKKSREWKINNPQKVKESLAKWRSEHSKEIKEYSKLYAQSHKEEIKEYEERTKEFRAKKAKEYRVNNKSQAKKTRDAWIAANPEKKREALKRWRAANPEKDRESMQRANKKRGENIKHRISGSISRGMRGSLFDSKAKAGRHWETLVDYTVDQLKVHLEKLFTPEMNWDNYGSVWEIDHKIPVSVHNFEKPEDLDFRICWSLKNLQPLEKFKNKSKSDNIERPFQPSLALAVGG